MQSELEKLRTELEEELEKDDGQADFWKPSKAGERVVGTLRAVKERTGKNGPEKLVELLDIVTGDPILFWLSRSVLRDKFLTLAPKRGDVVGVKFLGEKESKNGTKFFDYTVRVKRRSKTDQVYEDLNENVDIEDDPS
ncbi:hypothetical protein HYR54_15555 [Candidatus Acetothermia bacterium]|nr:hypothetical protein [Candidatus Acetothermia bacterium]